MNDALRRARRAGGVEDGDGVARADGVPVGVEIESGVAAGLELSERQHALRPAIDGHEMVDEAPGGRRAADALAAKAASVKSTLAPQSASTCSTFSRESAG